MHLVRLTNGVGVVALTIALSACSTGSHRTQSPPVTTTTTSTSTTISPATVPPHTTTVPTTAAAPPTTAAVPGPSPTPVVTIARWTGRQPATIYFSADGGNIVTHLRWSSWGASDASADGVWDYLSCQPNCASGTATPYPVAITLVDPVAGQFTKLIEHTGGPHGFTTTFTAPQLGQGACTNANNDSCAFS